MNDNCEVSIKRIKEALPTKLVTSELIDKVRASGDRISQVIVDAEEGSNSYYLTSMHYFYVLTKGQLQKHEKGQVKSVKFERPAPHGAVLIIMKNGDRLHLQDIIAGRAFDFLQDLKPKRITLSGYDNTIRGEFPQLLDPDHAQEIDRLRRWMQDGHISHYQYDDANPAYPKAGK